MLYSLPKILFLAVFSVIFLLSSCSRESAACPEKANILKGIVVLEYSITGCLHQVGTTFVIKSETELEAMVAQNLLQTCSSTRIPNFDFDRYSLLGISMDGTGCDHYYSKKVVEKRLDKKYIYTLTPFTCGLCDIYHLATEWVLVPRLPDDYTVEFIVED